MSIPKRVRVIVATVVVLLLIIASFVVFSKFIGSVLDTSISSTNVNTADDRNDLLQYEWPQFQGDSSFTRFSAGPAPEAPDILWKTNIGGIRSYISAFNGEVFVIANTTVFALDRKAGSIIWNTTVPEPGPWPAVYKIDDTHMVVGNSCLDPDTGQILWTSTNFSASPQPLFSYNVYSPEEKLFYVKESSYVHAWNFSDLSIPPILAWSTYVSGSGSVGSGIEYGDGKVFPGSYESHQMALDAKTGAVLWDTETTGPMLFSGTYSNGMFFRGGTHDNTFYAFNATTGKVEWTFNPGTSDGYWCVGASAAYGMVYELNKDGNLYALDENTGDVVWQYKGPSSLIFPGTPTVADGKIYATTGQAAQYFGGHSESEFACLDAYTGNLIWKLPIEAFAPRESVAIAYGNLYLIPGDVTTAVDSTSGNEYTTIGQIWALSTTSWPMWRHDPAHSAIGQSGPTNLTLRWKFTTGGAVVSSPSAAYGMIYVGSQDKGVYCIDARSGEFIWKFDTSARIKSSPAVGDGRVYIGPDDGKVYCLDAYNGSLIWMTPAGGYIPANFEASVMLSSSPALVGGKVYVGSLDTNLYCLNANNGDINWTYKTEGYITSSPAVADGAVYVISQEPDSGALYKLGVSNGSLIWKRMLPYQSMYQEGTDMHASPTVADGMVFASSNIKEYYGINATTGNIEWTYRDDTAAEFIICSTIYKDGKLFLIDKFFIVCVDAKNGHPIWDSFIGDELYVSPSYADGKLYVVTDQRHIYVLNATNGEKLGWFETSSNSWSAPTIYEGRVYVGNNNWNVYCLSEYPALNSNVTIEVANPKIVLGEFVTGRGHLVPRMANASVMLIFVRPDGTVDDVPVATFEKGAFSFTYTPDVAGNWTVVARWQSDKGYWSSAYSKDASIEVIVPTPTLPNEGGTGILMEYFYAIVAAIVIIVAAIVGYAYLKRTKK
jgi:outer membrane protein assembly factor BamB